MADPVNQQTATRTVDRILIGGPANRAYVSDPVVVATLGDALELIPVEIERNTAVADGVGTDQVDLTVPAGQAWLVYEATCRDNTTTVTQQNIAVYPADNGGATAQAHMVRREYPTAGQQPVLVAPLGGLLLMPGSIIRAQFTGHVNLDTLIVSALIRRVYL